MSALSCYSSYRFVWLYCDAIIVILPAASVIRCQTLFWSRTDVWLQSAIPHRLSQQNLSKYDRGDKIRGFSLWLQMVNHLLWPHTILGSINALFTDWMLSARAVVSWGCIPMWPPSRRATVKSGQGAVSRITHQPLIQFFRECGVWRLNELCCSSPQSREPLRWACHWKLLS